VAASSGAKLKGRRSNALRSPLRFAATAGDAAGRETAA
jgi:hypothetical protein